MRTVLIVANQTIGGSELEAAVRARLAEGECRFHLLVPVPPLPPSVIAVGLAAVESAPAITEIPDQREVATSRLATGLDWLARLGATATGEIGTTDAVAAVCAVVERGGIDEVLVSTLPSRLSRWLRQDLPRKLSRRIEVPVSVVTASSTPAPPPGAAGARTGA